MTTYPEQSNGLSSFVATLKEYLKIDRLSLVLLMAMSFTILSLTVALRVSSSFPLYDQAQVFIREEIYFILLDLDLFDPDTVFSFISNSLIWLAGGATLYIFLWLIFVAIIDFYNSVLITKFYTHPDSFHQSSYWLAISGRIGLRIAAFLLFVFSFYVALYRYLPWAVAVLLDSLSDSIGLLALRIFSTLILNTLILYLLVLLIRFSFQKKSFN